MDILVKRSHRMRVEEVPNGSDTDYIACCSCGWESLQTGDKFKAATEMCAVDYAEEEGRERKLRRYARHVNVSQEIGPRDVASIARA